MVIHDIIIRIVLIQGGHQLGVSIETKFIKKSEM